MRIWAGRGDAVAISSALGMEMTDTIANSSMPDETAFAVGDLVRLKSGGHMMTVTGIVRDSIECTWSVSGDCKFKKFPVTALVKSGPVSLSPAEAARRIAFVLQRGGVSLEQPEEKA